MQLVGQKDKALDRLPQQGVLALIWLQLLPEEGSQLAWGGAFSLKQVGACTCSGEEGLSGPQHSGLN